MVSFLENLNRDENVEKYLSEFREIKSNIIV